MEGFHRFGIIACETLNYIKYPGWQLQLQSKWMFLTASTVVKKDVFDHFDCIQNGCFNKNYHCHFVSQFGIEVKEYPKNPITLKPRYFDHFDHGQMDVFDCFNHGQNACFNNIIVPTLFPSLVLK